MIGIRSLYCPRCLQHTARCQCGEPRATLPAAPAPTAPSTLGQQVARAQAEMAKWSPEVRASVRLEGGDAAAPTEQAGRAMERIEAAGFVYSPEWAASVLAGKAHPVAARHAPTELLPQLRSLEDFYAWSAQCSSFAPPFYQLTILNQTKFRDQYAEALRNAARQAPTEPKGWVFTRHDGLESTVTVKRPDGRTLMLNMREVGSIAVADLLQELTEAICARQAPTEAPEDGMPPMPRCAASYSGGRFYDEDQMKIYAINYWCLKVRQAPDSRDAARYRWLREEFATSAIPRVWQSNDSAEPVKCLLGEELDLAIDAAAAQEKAQ